MTLTGNEDLTVQFGEDPPWEDRCEEPCGYPGCDHCVEYWNRMVDEGYWKVGWGWTKKGLNQKG